MQYRFVLFIVMLVFQVHVHAAETDTELKRLQSVLATLNQELEATYRQFQMVQEARRASVQQELYAAPRPGLDNRNYDDIIAAQSEARERERALSMQMDQLLAKAREIEAQKQPTLQRIFELLHTTQRPVLEVLPAETQRAVDGYTQTPVKPPRGGEPLAPKSTQ